MMTSNSTFLRKAAAHMPFAAALMGMAIVFGGIALFYFESSLARVATVAMGVLVLIAGIWFEANPFIKNERRYIGLRVEVDRFIKLTRRLNRSAVEKEHRDKFEQAKAAMHDSVERMAVLAGRTGATAEHWDPDLSVTNGSGTKQTAAQAE